MATIDIGKLTFTHKGDYAGGTAYVANDVVYYNGSAYVAKTSTTGNLPTSTAHWNTFTAGSGGIWNSGLSIGTAGQVVKVNSGASALEFGTVSSDYVKLATVTATGSATTVSLDGHFTSDYKTYEIIGTGCYGASNLNLRARFNQGGSAQSSGSYRTSNIIGGRNSSSNFTDRPGAWSSDNMRIFYNDSASDTHGSFNLRVQDPLNTNTYHHATWHGAYAQNGENGEFGATHGIGMWNGNKNALTGITFYNSAGGNMYGVYKLYGIK